MSFLDALQQRLREGKPPLNITPEQARAPFHKLAEKIPTIPVSSGVKTLFPPFAAPDMLKGAIKLLPEMFIDPNAVESGLPKTEEGMRDLAMKSAVAGLTSPLQPQASKGLFKEG